VSSNSADRGVFRENKRKSKKVKQFKADMEEKNGT
jgi:hypothetical protein